MGGGIDLKGSTKYNVQIVKYKEGGFDVRYWRLPICLIKLVFTWINLKSSSIEYLNYYNM